MIRRTYIDNNAGGQIHIAQTGSGPAVLLLHQTPRSWDEYREVMNLLGDKLHLVAMDLPGMGNSDSIGSQATIEAYADAAIAVAEWIGTDNLTVCGHHTGGVVAIEVAARRPDLVNALILSSTPWIDADERQARAQKAPIDTINLSGNSDHLTVLWAQRAPYYPKDTDHMDRFMTDALRTNDPAAGHHAVTRYEMEDAAPKIICPVLIIEHQQDPFASKHTQNLLDAFPQAHRQSIENGQVALEITAGEFAGIIEPWILQNSQHISVGG